jgi:conjugal transfer/type IV secretion protein DotA/TraY
MVVAFALYAAPPQEAMASTSADQANAMAVIGNIMDQPYDATDLAHKSLVRLFGGFIFKPFGGEPGDPPTALAHVLGYTNIVAMILGVIIMGYVILAGALNTAASGEMLGRSWSSVWLPLRTSVAFGMIVPATSGGEVFSVAQSLVVWMIIVGSNSATWLWEEGAAAIGSGAPVFSTQNFHDNKTSDQTIKSMTCAGIRSKLLTKKDGEEPNIGFVISASNLKVPDGAVNNKNFKYSEMGSLDLSKAIKVVFTDCGTITLPTSNSALSETNLDSAVGGSKSGSTMTGYGEVTAWQIDVQDKFDSSARAHLPTFFAKSKTWIDKFLVSGVTGKSIAAASSTGEAEAIEMQKTIAASAEDYGSLTVAYETYLSTVQKEVLAAATGSNFTSEMTKGGWMRAGAWFFETSRLQGFVQTMMTALNVPSTAAPQEFRCSLAARFTNCKEQNAEYVSYLAGFSAIAGEAESAQSTAKAASSPGNITMVSKKTVNGETVSTLDEGYLTNVSKSISSFFLSTIMSWGADNAKGTPGSVGGDAATNASGMISPFTAVSSLGRGLQQITALMWGAGLVASYFLGVGEGVWGKVGDFVSGDQVSGASGALKYLMATLVPVLSGVGALAFMLAFAIPFMPVTVWIMLVCGYLVTVIEAIAAAPLAVIMLATPEGEGIAGSSFKQALQMINAIILRPTLSIVGLFAAMTLSYVGFAILNDLFWSVAGLTTGAGLFEVLALIFIYATLAFKVCEYMTQVIFKIPDHIMHWMGGQMSRPFGEEAVGNDMTGALKQNTAIGGIAGVQGLKTAGNIVGTRVKAQNKAKEDEKADKKQ